MIPHDKVLYRQRHKIENMFGKIKDWHRIRRGARNAALSYDPLGRLWQVSGGPSGTTRFVYDGHALVAEYDQWGNMLKRYVDGAGADTPQVWVEGAGITADSRRYLFTNHQGSATAIADGK